MIRSYQNINRRKSRVINIGNIRIGNGAPISVQTMTNTPTIDIQSTLSQIKRVEKVGADIVRVSVPDQESSKAIKYICKKSNLPIIADIHFHYKRAIESAINGAACLRINPGNIGSYDKVKEVIKSAKDYGCAIRIGVNGGSLERKILEKYGEPNPEALVESAMNNIKILEDNDFFISKSV
jgi:Enzyme involved in the deoxyxylulose pathway of isoprenoid biosynthesis